MMMLKRFAASSVLLALAACATARKAPPKVDLTPAREAVAAARAAGAPERATETFTRAEGHLKEAESLTSQEAGNASENARQAESLSRLATAEAQCATALAQVTDPQSPTQRAAAASSAELERMTARLKKAEEEQRHLEDKVGVLQRDLDVTETEIIRTKARLKGTETKAEASSAIAEARILMRRLADDKRTTSLARCQELLAKAEQLLKEENYGAAAFFAFKAQDTATKAEDTSAGGGPDTAPTQRHYVVKVPFANLRKGPATTEPIVTTAPQGTSLDAVLARGEWIKVTFGKVTGWVHRSLVE